ncbi:MAG TPA: hypothetical protein VLA19_05995, partial [Herpetosiphonaceae bacterium]|nr:hypothetical protein [Herpetosiphonaceae bacterium]
MNTPSHLIMTAALRKRYRRAPIPTFAFLLGSVAPDIPLSNSHYGGAVGNTSRTLAAVERLCGEPIAYVGRIYGLCTICGTNYR